MPPDSRLVRSPISPSHFFTTDQEKTKLNWFLFEYARELESFIRRDKPLCNKLNKKAISRNVIAGFCIRYSKQMQPQILDRVEGRTDTVRMDHDAIAVHFPQLDDALVDRLLTVAAAAWDSQTEACCACPVRCISERDQLCPLFDDPEHWD